MNTRKVLGDYGEELASTHLERSGCQVLDRNWRCRYGELDIVAMDQAGCLVFCEVKTRRSARYGTAVEAVTPSKAARLRRLAGLWLDAHRPLLPGLDAVRIDVIAVTMRPGGDPDLLHLKAVA